MSNYIWSWKIKEVNGLEAIQGVFSSNDGSGPNYPQAPSVAKMKVLQIGCSSFQKDYPTCLVLARCGKPFNIILISVGKKWVKQLWNDLSWSRTGWKRSGNGELAEIGVHTAWFSIVNDCRGIIKFQSTKLKKETAIKVHFSCFPSCHISRR